MACRQVPYAHTSLEFHHRECVPAVGLGARTPAADAPTHGSAQPSAEALFEGTSAVAVEEVQGRHAGHLRVGHALPQVQRREEASRKVKKKKHERSVRYCFFKGKNYLQASKFCRNEMQC